MLWPCNSKSGVITVGFLWSYQPLCASSSIRTVLFLLPGMLGRGFFLAGLKTCGSGFCHSLSCCSQSTKELNGDYYYCQSSSIRKGIKGTFRDHRAAFSRNPNQIIFLDQGKECRKMRWVKGITQENAF